MNIGKTESLRLKAEKVYMSSSIHSLSDWKTEAHRDKWHAQTLNGLGTIDQVSSLLAQKYFFYYSTRSSCFSIFSLKNKKGDKQQ